MFIIYFSVAFIATLLGAVAGLGGGIIIKPVLTILADYNISTINLLSTCTIFAMSFVRVSTSVKNKSLVLDNDTFILIGGSIVGGVVGTKIFDYLVFQIGNDQLVSNVQSILLIILFSIVLIMQYLQPKFNVNITFLKLILTGISMGMISTFLGIGGGSINMIFLLFVFKFPIKDAVIKSTLIILFSQLSAILTVGLSNGFAMYNLEMLYVMIPGGIIGGYIGGILIKKISTAHVTLLFNTTIAALIIVSFYELIT